MLQSISAITPHGVGRADAASGGNPSAAYAADWRGDAGMPVRPVAAPPSPPPAANDVDLTARAKQDALLSADVYHEAASPPPGFHVARVSELTELGLTPQMLEQPGVSSFRARVYATEEGGETRYVVAFRGSATGEDWKNNFEQGAGLDAPSYAKALQIGRQIARSDADVTFTGHSLGGGLASAASIAGGREADTFNAAGLATGTIADARGIAAANGRGSAAVQAYHVPGEVLTGVQTGGDRVIGGLLGTIVAGPFGGLAGGIVADAPPAYGAAHTLPDVRPEGKSWLDAINPVDRHGMDWVLAGVGALR